MTLGVDSIDRVVGELPAPDMELSAPSDSLRSAVKDSCYQVFVDVLLYWSYIRSPSLQCLHNDSVIEFLFFLQ